MTPIRGGSKVPWVIVAFVGALLALPVHSSNGSPDINASELLFWESVKDSKHAEELDAYLNSYPDGKYVVLARARLKRLMKRKALEFLSDALSTALSIEDPSPRVTALRILAEAQAAVGDKQGAKNTFSEALSVARRTVPREAGAQLLTDIARAQAAAGDVRGARRTISEAFSFARRGEHTDYRAVSLSAIASVQAIIGDSYGAKRTVSKSLSFIGSAESSHYKGVSLTTITQAQAKLGDIPAALITAQRVEDMLYRGWANKAIVEAQIRSGDIQGAVSTARSIRAAPSPLGGTPKAIALSSVIKALAAAGDQHGAERIVTEALSSIRTVKDAFPWAVNAFSVIGRAQAAIGDMAGAKRTLSGALTTARLFQKEHAVYHIMALGFIAEAQAEVGDKVGMERTVFEALKAVRRINDQDLLSRLVLPQLPRALETLVRARASAGNIRGALSIARTLKDPMARAIALIDSGTAQME